MYSGYTREEEGLEWVGEVTGFPGTKSRVGVNQESVAIGQGVDGPET